MPLRRLFPDSSFRPSSGFCNRFGLAGKVENQCCMDRVFREDADLARKNCRRNKVTGNGAHLFAKARHFAGSNREGRFGRDVASSRSRAARRQDEVATDDVDEFAQRLFDVKTLIGNETLMDLDRRFDGFAAPCLESRDALVFINALTRPVRDRNEAKDEFVDQALRGGFIKDLTKIKFGNQFSSTSISSAIIRSSGSSK